MKYSDLKQSRRIKLLLIGNPKSGKTGLIATVANAGYKVLYIDVDNNPGIMNSYLTEQGKDNLYYVALQSRDPIAWQEFKAMSRRWKTKDEDLGDISDLDGNTVLVVDSASFLGAICLKAVLKEKNTALDSPSFNINLWGVMAERYLDEVARLCGSKYSCHVILTAHLREFEKKVDNIVRSTKTVPDFPGQQLFNAIPRYMNNVFLVQPQEGGSRKIVTTSTKDIGYLGCSAPKIIKQEEDMDLGAIMKRIENAGQS